MPELPEVETVKRSLKNRVSHRKITSVEIFYPKMIHHDLQSFVEKLKNQTIKDVKRRGKFLIFCLDTGYLLSHLRMEGKYFMMPQNQDKMKHEHLRFNFSDGMSLRYHDVRKFGTMHYKEEHELFTTAPLNKLGLEYDDPALKVQYIYDKIKPSNRHLKSILLDQSIITGIGNIYADEICFCLKKHPAYKVSKITKKTVEKMLSCIQATLDKAVALGGSSIRTYKDTMGFHGRFQNELNVHLQAGKPCPVCHLPIEKMIVANRGTYLCRHCQTKR